MLTGSRKEPLESRHPPPIGERLPRIDALAKVTGAARYPDDLRLSDALVGRILRSPHPHARIRHIDASRALNLPGVATVLTASDVPCNEFGLVIKDQPVVASEVVRYVGEPVALVAAEDEATAACALEMIDVDYEPLPAVTDPHLALLPGAIVVHAERGDNIVHKVKVRKGNTSTAWDHADTIVCHDYQTQFIDHAFMQPEAGTGVPGPDGSITIYVASQWPHDDQREIAHALKIPLDRVRIVEMAVGGAFGGREDMSVQIPLALLAVRTGRPVRITYTREESLLSHGKRHPFSIRYRSGATREGRLVAAEIEIVADAGAYASVSDGVLTNACTFATGPYDVPNLTVDGYAVYTNNIFTCAMRGFGTPQVAFAVEQQMDRLAAALDMDPVELRLRNCWTAGSQTATGQTLTNNVNVRETILQAAERSDWRREPEVTTGSRRRGRGMACAVKNIGKGNGYRDHAEAIVRLWDGRADVYVGCTECGQGSDTMLIQVAAASLKLPPEAICLCTSDTLHAPDAGSSSASRQTLLSGNAVRLACAQAARIASYGGRPSPHADPVEARALYEVPMTEPPDPETGQGDTRHILGYATQVVEVEVDIETGEIDVIRAVSAHDVGTPINPTLVEGQIEGGFVMGLGQALTEEFLIRDGHPLTSGFTTYLMPSLLDAPAELIPITLDTHEQEGPFGAKGVAELATIPVSPAIANAVFDATGVWVDTLPLSPERVRRALLEGRST